MEGGRAGGSGNVRSRPVVHRAALGEVQVADALTAQQPNGARQSVAPFGSSAPLAFSCLLLFVRPALRWWTSSVVVAPRAPSRPGRACPCGRRACRDPCRNPRPIPPRCIRPDAAMRSHARACWSGVSTRDGVTTVRLGLIAQTFHRRPHLLEALPHPRTLGRVRPSGAGPALGSHGVHLDAQRAPTLRRPARDGGQAGDLGIGEIQLARLGEQELCGVVHRAAAASAHAARARHWARSHLSARLLRAQRDCTGGADHRRKEDLPFHRADSTSTKGRRPVEPAVHRSAWVRRIRTVAVNALICLLGRQMLRSRARRRASRSPSPSPLAGVLPCLARSFAARRFACVVAPRSSCFHRPPARAGRAAHRRAGEADDRAVPESCVAARDDGRAKSRPHRLDDLRPRHAERLHGGGAGLPPGAPDAVPERRRARSHGRQPVRRRLDRRVRSRVGAEPAGMDREPVARSDGCRARDLGDSDERRGSVAGGRRAAHRSFRPTALRAVREGQPDLSRPRDRVRGAGLDGPRAEAVHQGVGTAEQPALVARRVEDRVRQRSRKSLVHRGLRREDALDDVPRAERRFRRRAGLVAGWQACRVHAPARHAVRAADAGRTGRHWQPAGSGRRRRLAAQRVSAGVANPFGPGGGAGRARPDSAPTACRSSPDSVARRSPAGTRSPSWWPTSRRGSARELWHNAPNDSTFPAIQRLHVGRRSHPRPGVAAQRRVGSLSTRSMPNADHREAGAAHDDEWLDRGRDVRRRVGRRQDALLLHERERHRAPAHLGGADGGRHADSRSRRATASRRPRSRSRRASSWRCCTSTPARRRRSGFCRRTAGRRA